MKGKTTVSDKCEGNFRVVSEYASGGQYCQKDNKKSSEKDMYLGKKDELVQTCVLVRRKVSLLIDIVVLNL